MKTHIKYFILLALLFVNNSTCSAGRIHHNKAALLGAVFAHDNAKVQKLLTTEEKEPLKITILTALQQSRKISLETILIMIDCFSGTFSNYEAIADNVLSDEEKEEKRLDRRIASEAGTWGEIDLIMALQKKGLILHEWACRLYKTNSKTYMPISLQALVRSFEKISGF